MAKRRESKLPPAPRAAVTAPADEGAEAEAQELDREPDGPEPEALEAEVVDEAAVANALVVGRRGAASGASIGRHDPLAAYMRDVARYPLLSADDQHALAVRYTETGDVDAARMLVTANLRLVVKIAYDYQQAHRNLLDLVQEGNIGLMQAVKKYDPYKGVKLSSYAAWWIRAYMLRFILNNHRLVKLGTTQVQRKLFFNLRKEKAKLEAMGIHPTAETIAARLGVPAEEVTQMDMRLSSGEASLDAPLRSDESKTVARVDLLPARGTLADEVLAGEEMGELLRDRIHAFGDTLTGKEAQIFTERLVAEDPRTLQSLGEEFGVTRERVRQLEKRVLEKLRRYLKEDLAEDVYDGLASGEDLE